MAENLLIKLEFNTPEGFIPFPDIQPQHYIEAIQYHIDIARERIQAIEDQMEYERIKSIRADSDKGTNAAIILYIGKILLTCEYHSHFK